MNALGANFAAAVARSRTIPALILNKSSRVIPGLRGTPAGMTTMFVCVHNMFQVVPRTHTHTHTQT